TSRPAGIPARQGRHRSLGVGRSPPPLLEPPARLHAQWDAAPPSPRLAAPQFFPSQTMPARRYADRLPRNRTEASTTLQRSIFPCEGTRSDRGNASSSPRNRVSSLLMGDSWVPPLGTPRGATRNL